MQNRLFHSRQAVVVVVVVAEDALVGVDIQKCECCQTSTSMQKKFSEPETLLCWMKRIRIFEIFEMELMTKLDVNNGVYTMDMWICLDETGPVFSWQGQLVGKPLSTSLQRLGALCGGEDAENRN